MRTFIVLARLSRTLVGRDKAYKPFIRALFNRHYYRLMLLREYRPRMTLYPFQWLGFVQDYGMSVSDLPK